MNKKSIFVVLVMAMLVLTVPAAAQDDDDGSWSHEDAVNDDDGTEEGSDSTAEDDSTDWDHDDAENDDDGSWDHENADNNDDSTDWDHDDAENDDDGSWDHENADNNDGDGSTTEDSTTEDSTTEDSSTDDTSGDTGGNGGGGGGDPDDPSDPSPDFQVSIDSPASGSSYSIGDNINVDYTVSNAGDASDSQNVQFFVDRSLEDSNSYTLDSGDSTGSETFTWDTSGSSSGSHDLTVSTENESASVDITLTGSAPNFQVDVSSPSDGAEFEPGDSVDVEYSVENTGQQSDTQDITFNVDEAEEASEQVTLNGGSTDSGRTFTWNTDGLDEGDYDLEVSSDDDTYSFTVTLDEDSGGGGGGGDDDDDDDSGGSVVIGSTSNDLSLELSHETIVAGGSVEASGFAENARAGQTVSIEIDGSQVAQTETESDGYYETTFTPEEVGTKTVTAVWDGAEASAELEVTPSVQITSFTAPQTVNTGEVFEICVQADSQVEPQFRLFEEGDSIDSGSGTGEVCFDRALDQAGTYDYELVATASSSRDSRAFSIQVTEQADTGGTAPEGITGAFLNAASSTAGRLLISIIAGAIITVLALSIEI